jgi:hypothetical protein
VANYPDILGTITNGTRLILDFAALAFGLRPTDPIAGQPFEAILIVQNDANCELDAIVKLIIPAKDLKGAAGKFATKSDKRIVIGLRPAEVGYVALPVIANPTAAPGAGYTLQIEVEITRKEKNPERVRVADGSQPIRFAQIKPELRPQIQSLSSLSYTTSATGRTTKTSTTLSVPFALNPPGISKLVEVSKAGWTSLWTMHDGLGGDDIAEQARRYTSVVLPQFNRRQMFFPLLETIQAHAEAAGYRLWAGEAVLIAKQVVLLMETGQPAPSADVEVPTYPRWFTRLAQLLLQQPDLANDPRRLATDLIFQDLLFDAALSAFTTLKGATTENLGSQQEMNDYADSAVQSFMGEGEPLDLIRVYLPLVLGGLLNNSRLMMAGESALDSLELLVNARIHREAERSEDNQFVFELLDELLDRGLSLVDKTLNLQRYLDPIDRLRFK